MKILADRLKSCGILKATRRSNQQDERWVFWVFETCFLLDHIFQVIGI